MSKRSPHFLVSDMLEYVHYAVDFTKGQSFDEFILDEKTKSAVLRVLSVLGEAANRIPKEIRDKYPEVEWGRIIRSRNVIIHDYEIIDYAVIWKIVTVHLPILHISLKKILSDIESH